MNRSWLLAALPAAAVLTACGGGQFTAHGTLRADGTCAVSGADFPDVRQGVQVSVSDPSGAVIDSSVLGAPHTQKIPARGYAAYGGKNTCAYLFTVQVPAGLQRYGITVGQRGPIWFSAPQMTSGPLLILKQ